MSTDLAVIQRDPQYLALVEQYGPDDALEVYNLMRGDDWRNDVEIKPIRVKLPSGGMMAFDWDGSDTVKTFEAVIVIAQKRRAWWPDSMVKGVPPLCSSPDGQTGFFSHGDEAQIAAAESYHIVHPGLNSNAETFPCASCPLAAWGSAVDSNGRPIRGQACKTTRLMILKSTDSAIPIVMSVPPSSLKSFAQYADAIAKEGKGAKAYWGVLTRFGLEKAKSASGIDYAKLSLTKVRDLTLAEMREAVNIRKEFVAFAKGVGFDVTDPADISGDVVDAEPTSVPF